MRTLEVPHGWTDAPPHRVSRAAGLCLRTHGQTATACLTVPRPSVRYLCNRTVVPASLGYNEDHICLHFHLFLLEFSSKGSKAVVPELCREWLLDRALPLLPVPWSDSVFQLTLIKVCFQTLSEARKDCP